MATTVLDKRPITNELLTLLATGTGKIIGDGRMPDDLPTKDPWAIVYSIDGARFVDVDKIGDDDSSFAYQVSCVGRSREQAEWMQDRVIRTLTQRQGVGWSVPWPVDLLADPPNPWSVIGRLVDEPVGGIDREGSAGNFLFTAATRLTIIVTPS